MCRAVGPGLGRCVGRAAASIQGASTDVLSIGAFVWRDLPRMAVCQATQAVAGALEPRCRSSAAPVQRAVRQSPGTDQRYRVGMLRRFIYLDRSALHQYITALEGGSLSSSSSRSLKGGARSGGVDTRVVRADGERSHEEESSRSTTDTDEARFDRLLRAAADDPEALAWIEVVEPDSDFDAIGVGAMVSWECDVYVPDIIQMLGQSGETLPAIGMMQELLPAATRLGLDTEGLPGAEEMEAVAAFVGGMNAKALVVGEDDDTDWRVAGNLVDEFVMGELDGRARLVGKVVKVLRPGQWKPYLSFPGMNLLSREERRKKERQRPDPGSEGEYLAGPALMLDVLAIYR